MLKHPWIQFLKVSILQLWQLSGEAPKVSSLARILAEMPPSRRTRASTVSCDLVSFGVLDGVPSFTQPAQRGASGGRLFSWVAENLALGSDSKHAEH